MSKKAKAILYNFLGFAPFFLLGYFLFMQFTDLTGLWIPLCAFVVSTILAPKFQAVKFPDGEKILMKWIFLKGIKEVK